MKTSYAIIQGLEREIARLQKEAKDAAHEKKILKERLRLITNEGDYLRKKYLLQNKENNQLKEKVYEQTTRNKSR